MMPDTQKIYGRELTGGRKQVRIIDTTLRDGEQAPGVVFSSDERVEIASMLAWAGVDEIEAGTPAMGEAACRDIRKMVDLKLPCTLTSWCRASEKDIEMASKCRTSGVHISFPTSSILLKAFDKDKQWVMSELPRLVSISKLYFDTVSVGAQDATRTDSEFLIQFCNIAADLGVQSLRLADTVGLTTPMGVKLLVKEVVNSIPTLPLEFHGHNDLGMATGNAVSAVEAGADALSVTVNGLGERAGNTALEEVCVALFGVGNYTGSVNLAMLQGLCRKVAAASGRDIAPSKAIVGENVFRHESGIHCAGLLRNSLSYQPFDPGLIGKRGRPEIVFGTHSGRSVIYHTLLELGMNVTREEASVLIPLVKRKSRVKKGSLSCSELKDLYQETFA